VLRNEEVWNKKDVEGMSKKKVGYHPRKEVLSLGPARNRPGSYGAINQNLSHFHRLRSESDEKKEPSSKE